MLFLFLDCGRPFWVSFVFYWYVYFGWISFVFLFSFWLDSLCSTFIYFGPFSCSGQISFTFYHVRSQVFFGTSRTLQLFYLGLLGPVFLWDYLSASFFWDSLLYHQPRHPNRAQAAWVTAAVPISPDAQRLRIRLDWGIHANILICEAL